MGRIGLCFFCLLKFSAAMCILLVKKVETVGNITTKSGSLRNSMQKCGDKCEKMLSPPWFQHCGGERPRRSDADVLWERGTADVAPRTVVTDSYASYV